MPAASVGRPFASVGPLTAAGLAACERVVPWAAPSNPFVQPRVRDVARYVYSDWHAGRVGPWYDEQGFDNIAERTELWDNASTHSAVLGL